MLRTTLFIVILAAMAGMPAAHAFELSGDVQDAAGRPVAGADVWLSQNRVVCATRTDDAGSFVFGDVAVGPANVVARREGLALGGRDIQVAGSAHLALVLGEPGAAKLRFVDPTRYGEEGHLPVPGARLETLLVGDAFHVPVEDLVPSGFPSIRSDDDGRMVVADLPKGTHIGFTVGHRRYADAAMTYLPVGIDELTVRMTPGVVLRGRVTDEAKQGIARARVSVFRYGRDRLVKFKEAMTDPDGFYRATVAPGEFYVVAKHEQYAAPQPVPVVLADPEQSVVLDLTMPDAHLVRGVVLGPDGAPLGGVAIAYAVGDTIYDEIVTTQDGAFCLQAASGTGRIHVFPPDGFIAAADLDPLVEIRDEAEVTLAEPVRLDKLPEVTGTVLDEDGAPAPGVLIRSLDTDPVRFAISDENGAFRIRLSRVRRQETIRFRAEHARRFLRADFEVDPPKMHPGSVQLRPFLPDVSPCVPEHVLNHLAILRDEPAPAIVCDRWFNLGGSLEEDGKGYTLKDLRGRVAVLFFWAGFDETGRGPECIRELRVLHRLLHDADDVIILGIHAAASMPKDVESYIAQYHIDFPVGQDVEDCITFDGYDINAIPQTVLIDKKGVLRYYDVEGRLLELIKALRREG